MSTGIYDPEWLDAKVRELSDANKKLEGVKSAASALVADVRARYPGEELRCPHMIALDVALKSL